MFLLDTNVCVEFLRSRNPGVLLQMQSQNREELRICSVVFAELHFGALRSLNPAGNIARVDEFAATVQSIPFDNNAARMHAKLRIDLATRGLPIGPHDLQIAAIALANDLVLVTHNVHEFQRIAGLHIVDWQT